MIYDQKEYDIRSEWGINGIETLARVSDVIIIADILSFSTSVDIAVSRGAIVFPYFYKNGSAVDFAFSKNAILAESDKLASDKYTLSPASLINIPANTKIVLPSPNGSTLSLSTGTTLTLSGSFRNAKAVAEFAMSKGKQISVIPAGEKWTDGSVRYAVEDLAGAGAIISFLKGKLSPESRSALAVYKSIETELKEQIEKCVSGKELIERGFGKDIDLASDFNVSSCVPGMINGAYVDLSKV
ncbi:MAG TPA: 2-phosphosulfolactate phosphatase [Ignavibacteria bacterium]|nr:2-phosphosulfolactate phosphatase [Ignavibacteria bacterium]